MVELIGVQTCLLAPEFGNAFLLIRKALGIDGVGVTNLS